MLDHQTLNLPQLTMLVSLKRGTLNIGMRIHEIFGPIVHFNCAMGALPQRRQQLFREFLTQSLLTCVNYGRSNFGVLSRL